MRFPFTMVIKQRHPFLFQVHEMAVKDKPKPNFQYNVKKNNLLHNLAKDRRTLTRVALLLGTFGCLFLMRSTFEEMRFSKAENAILHLEKLNSQKLKDVED